MTERHSSQPRN